MIEDAKHQGHVELTEWIGEDYTSGCRALLH
jgi:hypothetical protein